ncbi:hypothetical protein PanWU01x14_296560 [Parasponia andersonii]|uniref:Uncharacterized protein n=1 Tax=Parasponia andersonii TaxID=3476 RepID=A0A2P5AVC9_PARAD|nr:hypothetical protein PanWU01x14_296560 [Parasponia andersonii]
MALTRFLCPLLLLSLLVIASARGINYDNIGSTQNGLPLSSDTASSGVGDTLSNLGDVIDGPKDDIIYDNVGGVLSDLGLDSDGSITDQLDEITDQVIFHGGEQGDPGRNNNGNNITPAPSQHEKPYQQVHEHNTNYVYNYNNIAPTASHYYQKPNQQVPEHNINYDNKASTASHYYQKPN